VDIDPAEAGADSAECGLVLVRFIRCGLSRGVDTNRRGLRGSKVAVSRAMISPKTRLPTVAIFNPAGPGEIVPEHFDRNFNHRVPKIAKSGIEL